MALKYRREIDGMRAIAVLAVMIYHLRISWGTGYLLPGGFLGVDLFFVLSGFLITKILATEIDKEGRLDFGNFYLRRARRILPPLLLVIAFSIPAAYAILPPSAMEWFAESIWAALGFYSNIFWFLELREYGAQSGLLQPFLHTWSLAIEEQFYLVFPVILLAGMRWMRRWVLPIAVLGIVGGLVVAQATTLWQPELSFFSPASRAWELLAGAALALLSQTTLDRLNAARIARYLPSFGILLVLGSMYFLGLDDTLHPGIATVPTILGTCLVILFANPADPATRLLATEPAVFIGKLSYSLYLWHFPIFAFGRMLSPGAPDGFDMAVWVGLTFLFSYLGYRLVETPMRRTLAFRHFMAITASAVALAVATPFVLKSLDMRQAPRAAALAEFYGPVEYDNETLRVESWSPLQSLEPNPGKISRRGSNETEHEASSLWFTDGTQANVLVVGNSHSKDMYNALVLNRDRFPGVAFARFALENPFPRGQIERLMKSPNYQAADIIAFAPRWNIGEDRLDAVITRMQQDGKQIVLVDNTAEFVSPDFRPLFDYQAQLNHRLLDPSDLNTLAYQARVEDRLEVNAWLRSFAEERGIALYSRQTLLCSDDREQCTLALPDGDKALYDYGHWTLKGARHFGAMMAERGWFSNTDINAPRSRAD